MKTRPRALSALAAFLLSVAGGLPLQIFFLYGDSPLDPVSVAAKLTPLNWAILVLAPACAWLVWRASPWLIAAAPVLTALVLRNNLFVAEIGTDYSALEAALASGAFMAAMATLLSAEVRGLLFNPELRWWLTPQRTRVLVPTRLQLADAGSVGREIRSRTYDISETGAFLPFEATPRLGARPVGVGTRFSLTLGLSEYRSIRCCAEVVRVTHATGHYPAGLGVRFLGLGYHDRRELTQFLRKIGGHPIFQV